MKIKATLILILLSSLILDAQNPTLYSRARINMEGKDITDLAKLGIDATHGIYAKERFYINDFADYELERIAEAGFSYEIEIADVQAYYANQPEEVEMRSPDCDDGGGSDPDYAVPENFSLGTMAGFYTYQEMLENLDAMQEQYPDLITVKTPIDGHLTIEGRPIYWLRISDNPNVDEDEPEVFYNAVHHAREPNSLTQLIFYMWYVLENYDNDPEIKYLVDNTEMYFVPCINPDGYIYNEANNPSGGGLWRKNRRLNDDGTYGVDLNRNYGFEWGYDNSGSSPNPSSQTYRGTEPFSEPETQAIRDFCNAHEFQIALNYHTYGNLLIYPWGYLDTPTEDAPTFNAFAEAMTFENNYLAGTGTETVGYVVNGDSDDWMYGENVTKPAIFSMTPEVGTSGGFWPSEGNIIPNCLNTMLMNITAANLVHNYGIAEEKNEQTLTSLDGEFKYDLKRYGLQEGPLTVSISAISDNIASVGTAQNYDLEPYDQISDMISYSLSPDIQSGEEVVFQLSVYNGIFSNDQIITKTYSVDEPVFFDSADVLSNWDNSAGLWGISTTEYYSPSRSITDSPFGNYSANTDNLLTLAEPIDMTNAVKVILNFWTKWDIEEFYDYAQVSIAIDETDFFIPVCGKYTVNGSTFQDLGQPIYEGVQGSWVQEEIDLTDYVVLGQDLYIRFAMIADNGVQRDGFYFDDLSVTVFYEEVNQTIELNADDFIVAQNRPNPADGYTIIDLEQGKQDFEEGRLMIYNALGQLEYEQMFDPKQKQGVQLNTSNWQSGVYYYQVELDGKKMAARRMSILH